MDATAIAEAFRTGDLVDLIKSLELTNVEIIPTPDGLGIMLGTVGAMGVVVTSDGAMVIHGHGEGNEIQAQACQARMSAELYSAMAEEIFEGSAPIGYQGRHTV